MLDSEDVNDLNLLQYWKTDLGGSRAEMLQYAYERYPHTFTDEELGNAIGIVHTGGSFGTYLGRLRALELIMGSRSALRATEAFFQ